MSTYVIGDVHGCFNQFLKLLQKIKYDPHKDRIILTGDLVNRGPDSLAMLNYCIANRGIETVLGNHDLYLMYLLSIGKGKGKLKNIIAAKNNTKIFKWLLNRPFLIKVKDQASKNIFFITHAGIPEIWSPSKAQKLATEASHNLKKNPTKVLQSMWGDNPKIWNDQLTGEDRQRVIINYFTRMRFLSDTSKLDLKNTGSKSINNLRPWFRYASSDYKKKKYYYIFGHWASLNGRTQNQHFIGLDTGCVWKGKLTALRLEDLKRVSVQY